MKGLQSYAPNVDVKWIIMGDEEMVTEMEIRERNKAHLASLLKIKKELEGNEVRALREEILNMLVRMETEDVALVEKLIGVKALD